MTVFAALPVPVQNGVCFWAVALCFAAIAEAMLLLRQRRDALFGLAAALFACAYLAMQLCRGLSELRLRGERVPLVLGFGTLPWPVPIIALTFLTLLNVLLWRSARRWRRSHISPASIKESLDGLPAGVCCYLDDGRCILVNHRMNDVCYLLLGRSLQNGALLAEAALAAPVHRLADGSAVAFRSREFTFEGRRLHELIADDVTELDAGTQQLRRDAARAEQLRAAMLAYGGTIDDTVRRQEILQAKIEIHDRMNRMLLATQKAARPDADARERAEILRLWRSQTTLLGSGAAPAHEKNLVADLNALAAVIGIEPVWDGSPEGDERALSLLLLAAREAMTNAAKHAGAARLFIRLRADAKTVTARFTNDGAAPSGRIDETGGLALLRQSVERAGGTLSVSAAEGFCLTVTIPKGGNEPCLTGC